MTVPFLAVPTDFLPFDRTNSSGPLFQFLCTKEDADKNFSP